MKIALISLSRQGARVAHVLAAHLAESEVYLHRRVGEAPGTRRFDHVADLARGLFARCRGLVFIGPAGIAVRAVAPLLGDKRTDPAVVVVDVGGRWAVSLLGGHEGGANELATAVSNILSAEPVITTTTEAAKTIIVGIGCRRGTPAEAILGAVGQALAAAGATLQQVRLLASADVKRREAGLLEASRRLGIPLRLISSEEIRSSRRDFGRSDFVRRKVDLPAVAEPAALLAGRRTRLLLPKQKFGSVTVALAAENCTWSE